MIVNELFGTINTWEEVANLLGQPIKEVMAALLPGERIESFLKKNERDILEAREFREVLRAIGNKGKIGTAFYPGGGADLIPDEILSDEFSVPVYKTSSPSEFNEQSLMFPEKFRKTYFPAVFGKTQLPISKADLIILRNVPNLPELYEEVIKYSGAGTLVVVFENPFKRWCSEKGFNKETQDYISKAESGIEVYKQSRKTRP